jgi:hypothetical protein
MTPEILSWEKTIVGTSNSIYKICFI